MPDIVTSSNHATDSVDPTNAGSTESLASREVSADTAAFIILSVN